jgi:hypothetical protein
MHRIKKNILELCGKEPETLDELAECVIKIINTRPDGRSGKKLKVVGFAWDLTYSRLVSNTHHCPLNGKTNWAYRNKDVPRGYPGWVGRVWIRYSEMASSFSGSDAFYCTATHTGTGGGGSYGGIWGPVCEARWKMYGYDTDTKLFPRPECFSWDYRIFADDWPLLAADHEAMAILSTLNGGSNSPGTHHYCWEDPTVKARDSEFLELVKDRTPTPTCKNNRTIK